MKPLFQAVAAAAFVIPVAAPVAALAQSNEPLTRAQVRAELVQLEQAGYYPSRGEDPHYPDDIQAAEARVAAQSGGAGGYGGVVSGSSDAGRPTVSNGDWSSMYNRP
jgi:hypothetical protein